MLTLSLKRMKNKMDINGMACSPEFMDNLWRREKEVREVEYKLRQLVIMGRMEVRDALEKILLEELK